MKVFLDTNILMEYFANRTKAADVKVILQAAYQGQIKACMSVGCLYTLIYLLGIYLKNQGIHEPDKTLYYISLPFHLKSRNCIIRYVSLGDPYCPFTCQYSFCTDSR